MLHHVNNALINPMGGPRRTGWISLNDANSRIWGRGSGFCFNDNHTSKYQPVIDVPIPDGRLQIYACKLAFKIHTTIGGNTYLHLAGKPNRGKKAII
jgi:hypothetical protein